MFEEVWRDVVDFEGLYQVSNKGNFRRHPNKVKKSKLERAQHNNRLGYKYVTLCKDGVSSKKTTHQIVARAFLEGFEYGDPINHIDGNKQNNNVSNLEKTTSQDNNIHALKHDLRPVSNATKLRNVYIRRSKYKDKVYTYYYGCIRIDGKDHHLGQSTCPLEIAQRVDSYLDSIGDTKRPRNFSKP